VADVRLVTSALTPEVAPLLFDHEQQLSAFIDALRTGRRLSEAPTAPRAVAVVSLYDILAERFVLHASRLLPSLVDTSVYLFWHRLYPQVSLLEVLRHLRNFLVEAWLREDKNADVNELAVLSFDDADTLTIDQLTNIIRSVLTRLGLVSVIAVIEPIGMADSATLHAIAAAVPAMQRGTLSTVTAVFIGSPTQLARTFSHNDALLLSLDQVPEEWRETFMRAAGPAAETGSSSRRSPVTADLLELVVPLTALQGGASRDIVSYIEMHMRASHEEVDRFIREHFVVPLMNGGMSLSEHGLRAAAEGRQRVRAYDEIVSNGSRIVAFVPPENLVELSTLDALRQYVDTNFRLVDTTGAMLSLRRSDLANARRLARDLTAQIEGNEIEFQRSNEYHHATLIKYISQVLMRPRYELDATFFRYLERLSRGFAEYLVQTVDPRSEGLYRASRLMTNIAYVYDHMPEERRAIVQVRRELLAKAADLLVEHTPMQPLDIARFAYAEGWQRWDAGDPDGGAAVFLRAAKRLERERTDSLLDARPDGNVVLLASLIFVIDRGDVRDEIVRTALLQHLRDTGIVTSIEELRRLLFSPPYTLALSNRHFGIPPAVALYFCPFDFVAAFGTARYLMQHKGVVSRLHVVTEESPFRLDKPDLVHIVIGGPDTPGAVGEVIGRVNPMSAFVFQVKSTEDFADIDVVRYEGRDFITTSGSGLTHDDNWAEFWNRHPSIKEKAMDGVILGELVSTILTTAGTRLSELFIDQIVDRVKSFLDGDRGEIAPSEVAEIEEVRSDLNHIAQAGKTVTTPELIAALHLDRKSPAVASSVGKVLAPGAVAEAFDRIFDMTEEIGADPKRLADIAGDLLRVANKLRALPELAMKEKLWLDRYESALRTLRFEAEDLRMDYETSGTLNAPRMADVLRRFASSSRGFATFLRDFEMRGA
jgi:hypothetical protein